MRVVLFVLVQRPASDANLLEHFPALASRFVVHAAELVKPIQVSEHAQPQLQVGYRGSRRAFGVDTFQSVLADQVTCNRHFVGLHALHGVEVGVEVNAVQVPEITIDVMLIAKVNDDGGSVSWASVLDAANLG